MSGEKRKKINTAWIKWVKKKYPKIIKILHEWVPKICPRLNEIGKNVQTVSSTEWMGKNIQPKIIQYSMNVWK